jgi:hypothetical protein
MFDLGFNISGIVTLICGPPYGGKSTYVQERLQPGDLIIDTDAIGAALSGLPVHQTPDAFKPLLFAARDAVGAALEFYPFVKKVWVVECCPDPVTRTKVMQKWRASFTVILATPIEVCLGRMKANPRPGEVDWEAAIRRWWNDYRPLPTDRVVEP